MGEPAVVVSYGLWNGSGGFPANETEGGESTRSLVRQKDSNPYPKLAEITRTSRALCLNFTSETSPPVGDWEQNAYAEFRNARY